MAKVTVFKQVIIEAATKNELEALLVKYRVLGFRKDGCVFKNKQPIIRKPFNVKMKSKRIIYNR